ncbi:class I SAM-dependent methyltransferase [Paucidesulfovibrio longus]|uniref:class I SAM-dependent methyltransferase n=1 Tax=Paucidesulfovibrio longus TaxID=889 RepID=UPI0003B30F39|nr:class I SAM-dependent methyltransferase [Paucidesulfovibrio longus]
MYDGKAAFFDAQAEAPWADGEYGPEERAKLKRLFGLLPDLRGAAVLEPGCGTGRLTRELSEAVGGEGAVLALDISPRMVAVARKRLGDSGNVELRVAELETCELSGRVFDAVLCHQVFPHFNDQSLALTRIAGLLRSTGLLVISHFIGRERINDVHRKAGTAVEADLLPEEPEMRALLEAAGFEILHYEDEDERYLLSARLRG